MLVFPEQDVRIGFMGNTYFIIDANNTITPGIVPYHNKHAIMAGKYDEDTIWVGYQYGGVILMDIHGNIKAHYLKESSVTKVFTDHEGGLWMSTLDQGVFYCSQPQIRQYPIESYPVELTKDKTNQLYVALHNGNVLTKSIDTHDFVTIHTSTTNYIGHAQYDAMADKVYYGDINTSSFKQYSDGVIGVSDDEDLPIPYSRRSIYLPANDSLFIKPLKARVYDITLKEDYFLIGTNEGLYQYKNQNHTLLSHKNPYFSYRISDIDYRFDKLQMSTMGGGFVVEEKDTLFAVREKDGLLSDICTEVFPEDKYTTWVGTNRGLSRVVLYENNSYTIKNISIEEGLPCSEVTDIEIINDTIWVAAKEGLFSFSKKLLNTIDEPQEKWLHFNSITVNDEPIAIAQQSQFSHKENTVDFSFASISFRQENSANYRYKLHEKDSIWQYTQNQSVRFTSLRPGNYDFTLQTQTEDKKWTPPIQYSFVISKPFWKPWWFVSAILLSIGLLIYLIFKYRLLIFDKRLANHIGQELLDRLKIRNEKPLFVIIKQDGKTIQLHTTDIGYFKSARNYTEIYTASKKYLIRKKLVDFYEDLPDAAEYIRLHRSYYVRIDQVQEKGVREVVVLDTTISVSKTYQDHLDKIMVY